MAFGLRQFNAGIVTRPLPLLEISLDPAKPVTLLVRHAGSTNPAWDSWSLRQSIPDDRVPTTADARAAERTKARARSIDGFVEAVVVGWENLSEDGAPAPFSADACRRFLGELAENCPDVWNQIQLFCYTVGNFRGAADAEALGKESPRG